ncbi:Arc family DNA binding domain-containing protein [Pedobacter sp. SL55]|uniref:Arc family DNA binding domain-containing protein n=1 Tax=Pedobacter sp. SL55 TaxID=2995161 RepID=UPI00226F3E26|nr:Arc family DNA binding domain-containing protein [Pedobacter sp. SL55]WAC39382.1 Arc family DNA binding domain-containing protein [Pedobacter sp. SL55]
MPDKEKKAFALRISPALLKEIEHWASNEFRSTNGQIEYILNEAVKARNKKMKKDNGTASQ